MIRRGSRTGLLLCLGMLAPGLTEIRAHDFSILDVLVVVKSNGTYQADLTIDLDALALGAGSSADSAELAATLEGMPPSQFEGCVERARDTLLRRVRIRFDGDPQRPALTFPGLEGETTSPSGPPSVLGTTARFSGTVPEGARELTFFASRAFGPVNLTIVDQRTLRGARHLIDPGGESPSYLLDPAQARAAAAVAEPAAPTFARYIGLGFQHILPKGLDHILFVLGLFLLSRRWKPLLWQITAFTVAHTATLALSIYGLLALPSRLVESLIAVSIAYVALENLFTAELKPWRPVLVFTFGLLHGLGFAGVLRALGLPRDEFLPALIGFNVGVELGQLAVVGLAFLIVGWFRGKTWYRPAIVVPTSLAVALVGLYWAVQRALLGS